MATFEEYIQAGSERRQEEFLDYLKNKAGFKRKQTAGSYFGYLKHPVFTDFLRSHYNLSEIYECTDLQRLKEMTAVCKKADFNTDPKIHYGYSAAMKKYIEFIESMTKIDDTNSSQMTNSVKEPETKPKPRSGFSIWKLITYIGSTGLLYSDLLIKRVAFSLLSKRFLILSGLAGSGKTQLAIAFAEAFIEKDSQFRVVAVGADWTNREPLLGFPNALEKGDYVKPESGVLDLLIEANKPENKNKPYFLILDEMNMSYVERYFADFLSAMESHREIPLWDKDGNVPKTVKLSDNVFIIGTINVDETTYMFSPKVLDRANVIEFQISPDEMEKFLTDMKPVDRDSVRGKAKDMAEEFVELARKKDLTKSEPAKKALGEFFEILKKINAEFGYRTATEIYRFISQAETLDDTYDKMSEDDILDCAIVQKLLPKLHGSRKKLNDVLTELWKVCFTNAEDKEAPISDDKIKAARFKLAADKICRMHKAAEANGFASFAEA